MPISTELSAFTPHEAATAVGVGVQSIRRWCEWHAIHLSDSASPGPGIPRRLTRRDVEVLKAVKDLRYQGLQTEAINDRLYNMVFPEIDSQVDSAVTIPITPTPDTNALDAQHSTLAVRVALDDLRNEFDAKLAVLQRSREPSFFVGFGAGFIAALLLMIAIILLAVLYGGFR